MKLEITHDDLLRIDRIDLRMMQVFVRWMRFKYRCKWVEYEHPDSGGRILELHIGDKRHKENAE